MALALISTVVGGLNWHPSETALHKHLKIYWTCKVYEIDWFDLSEFNGLNQNQTYDFQLDLWEEYEQEELIK